MDLVGLIGKAQTKTEIEPIYKKLGANVASMRTNAGMTQSELGQAAGMGTSTVAEVETGSTRILLSDLEKLAQALGVQPKQLLIGIWF